MPASPDDNNRITTPQSGESYSPINGGGMVLANVNDEALRQILVTSGHAYMTWRVGEPTPHISDSLAIFLGYVVAEFSTLNIAQLLSLVHKRERRTLLLTLRAGVFRGGSYECDFRMRLAKGSHRWFRMRGISSEHDAHGFPAKLIGCIFDIDELKQAQLQAEKEKEKSEWLRSISTQLFESTNSRKLDLALASLMRKLACKRTYMRLKNPVDGNLDIVAESYAEALSPVREIISKMFPGMLHKEFVQMLPGQDLLLLSTGPDSSQTELELSLALETRYAAIIPLMQSGQIVGELVLLSAVDPHWSDDDLRLAKEFSRLIALIFEREAIATSLRESDERFNLAMQASQDGLWDAQIGQDRVYVSPSYFRMTGRDLPGGIYPREITGVYIHPDDLLMVRERLGQFVGAEKENDSIVFRMRHEDGSDVWILSRMYKAELNADGSTSRVIGVNTDITEFKRIQDYLKTAQTEADAANRAKSEFLARMSHEIRTPMNAILGLSQLVLESELQTEQRGYVQHIDDAGQLLLNVINDILDFSKIEAGKLELDEIEFNLDEVISRISNLFVYKAEEKDIWLVIDLDPNVPRLLRGDVTRLQQVLVNLLNNAIKFTDAGGVFFGIALSADQRLVFTVRDSGIGIDEESLQFLFTPFSQADGSVTRRYGGTGLGLAICKYLVEMMGGAIEVESVKGIGSRFSVVLPFIITAVPAQVESPGFEAQVAVISAHSLVLEATKNIFSRYTRTAKVSLHPTFAAFAESVGKAGEYLCVIDDDMMSEDQLIASSAQLQNRFPHVAIRYAYLGKNSLLQKYSQRLPYPVVIVSKPLTPEKAHMLLFPQQALADSSIKLAAIDQWQHCKVLLVEDNPVNQKVALGMLRKYGLDVEVVTDGQQAIDRLQRHGRDYYRLILMDMEMPVMDGYAATRSIRLDARFTDLPIIAMTAHAMKGDRERCLAAGMNDYVSKPINSILLRETLAKYLSAER